MRYYDYFISLIFIIKVAFLLCSISLKIITKRKTNSKLISKFSAAKTI